MKKQAKQRLADAVIEVVSAVSGRTDPLIARCCGQCRHDVLLASAFLISLGMSPLDIARAMGCKPQRVMEEVSHLAELKDSDPYTLKRKIALIINGVRVKTGVTLPNPVV